MSRERYTYFDGGKWRLKIGDTEYSGEVVDRLAAYEETGLEPERIELLIPADDVAEVRHGRWIFDPGKIPYCSECKEYSDDGDKGATFCPWCGARMGKEDEHEAD